MSEYYQFLFCELSSVILLIRVVWTNRISNIDGHGMNSWKWYYELRLFEQLAQVL